MQKEFVSLSKQPDYWAASAQQLSHDVLTSFRERTDNQEISDELSESLREVIYQLLVAKSQGIESISASQIVESADIGNSSFVDELLSLGIMCRTDDMTPESQYSPHNPLLYITPNNALCLNKIAWQCWQLATYIKAKLQYQPVIKSAPKLDTEKSDTSSEAQQRIVNDMVGLPFALLTGGPGTGKTTTAVRIIKQYQASGVALHRIALTAPTGKAVQRLGESVRGQLDADMSAEEMTFSTLHRLLQLREATAGVTAKKQNLLLKYQLIIVDEASMLNYALMLSLLEQLPLNTHVIFMGDANQLGPIGIGQPFQSLIRTLRNPSPVFELTKSYRFTDDSVIGNIAKTALNGTHENLVDMLNTHDALHDIDSLDDQLKGLYAHYRGLLQDSTTSIETLLEASLERKCLTSHNDGLEGSESINARLNNWMQTGYLRESHGEQTTHYHGQVLMMTWNDYQNELYNGDMGICVNQNDEFYLAVPSADTSSGSANRLIPMIELSGLVTAYAITVHKSQGSEYNQVLVCLSQVMENSQSPLIDRFEIMNRAMVYTAITRAKHSVSLCSTTNSIKHTLRETQTNHSVLSELMNHQTSNQAA